MFLYGAAVLVLLINQNAVETSYSATTAAFVHPKHELASFNKGELARLIHQVIDSDNEYRETFDTENGRKVTKLFGVAAPLDLDYVDLTLNRALKSSNRDIANLLYKNLVANRAHAEDPSNSDFAVRIHLIKNPEVLEQYRKKLNKEHASTSSSSGYDDSLEYDRNVEKFIRRNAVLRLDSLQVVAGRQYDVETEAMKLYGEDLSMVLKRFRRSPEYMAILKKRIEGLKETMEDIITQVTYAYESKVLQKYVNETHANDTETAETRRDDGALVFRQMRRYGTGDLLQAAIGQSNQTTTTKSPVEMLDAHAPLHSPFTVAERNNLKDIGFKVAGLAIHKITEGMGREADQSELQSTRMPPLQARPTTTQAPEGDESESD